MKKSLQIILMLMIALILILTVSCNYRNIESELNNDKLNVNYFNKQLDMVKTNHSWSESTESYQMILDSSDKVNVIIEVDGESLLNRYLNQSTYSEMKDYAISAEGDEAVRELTEIQNSVKELLEALEYKIDYGFIYTSLFNGFSATINYGDVEKLEELQVIDRVIVCEEYAVPDVIDIDSIQETMSKQGLYKNETGYNGEGMLIAVLDTGLDYTHPAFQQMLNKTSISKNDIEAVVSSLYGNKETNKFTADQLYYSSKIPFQFDYAMNDADVMPKANVVNSYSGYHGTHVAGIIAGYSEEENVIGAAYNAQLAIMKVFPDSSTGASTASIVAALSDCAIIGVDAINMSLGTPAGYTYERSNDLLYVNEMYELLDKLGISVVVSAGNNYNQSKITKIKSSDPSNPDIGVISSPSTYGVSISIASVNAYKSSWFWHNETEKFFMESAVKLDGSSHNCENMVLNGNNSYTFDIIPIPNVGAESDYNGLDVTGKTVLIQRGDISFEEKQKIAAKFGAKACIIYNNERRTLFGAQINELSIPTFTITKENGLVLVSEYKENNKAELTLNKFNNNYSMSDFSSWGCGSDLTLKPEITAPGGNIYSTMPLSYKKGSYAYLSGTSMAAPNFAAVNAVVRQYLKENFPSLTNKEIRTLSYQLLMSTANLAVDDYGTIVSPRKQGAGVADVNAAVNTKAYLTVTGSDRTKLELGDDKNRDGIYTLNFNLINFDTRALSYDVNAIVMTETVVNGFTAERGHLFTDRKLDIIAKNASINGTIITVEAGETAKITITITLTAEEKAYIDELFVNGMYVEGFATLIAIEEDSEDLSIPFLAFYGDWTDAPIFDKTIFENEQPYISSIYITGSYNRNSYRMGDYQYVLPNNYEESPASYNKIALSMDEEANSMIVSVTLPLLRNATEIYYRIIDEISGQEYYRAYGSNIKKSYWENGRTIINLHTLNINIKDFDWMNNQKLIFKIECSLDYNGRNKTQILEFPLYIDSEKPSVVDSKLRQENNRTYVDVKVYDNHILQDYFISTVNDEGNIKDYLSSAIPVYEKDWKVNENNVITMDVTDYLDKFNDGKIAIIIDDSAYNQSAYYLCQISEERNKVENGVNAEFIESEIINTDDGNLSIFSQYGLTDETVIMNTNSEEHEFTIENNELISYNGPGGEIIIPDGVISIGKNVFYFNYTITKIVLPEGLTIVNDNAFTNCVNMKEIKLPTTLEIIGTNAFRGCYGLEHINLQDTNIYKIGGYAFYACAGLKEIIIPKADRDVEIAMNAFSLLLECEKVEIYANISKFLGTFDILPKCKAIYFYGNINTNISMTSFVGLETVEIIEFHGNIKDLGNNSLLPVIFSNAPNLKKVEFFGNVEGITSCVFSHCLNLEEVIFHGYLKKLNRQYAFGMSKLTRFTVAKDNQYMIMDEETGIMYNRETKDTMFMPSSWDYDGIFELPQTVKKLNANQFSHTSHALRQVIYTWIINENTTSHTLGTSRQYYVQERTLLKGVKLHNEIKEIPIYTFFENVNLTTIENIDNVIKIGDYSFASCKNIENIVLPNLTSIGNYAFQNCISLKNYSIPEKVTTLGSYVFDGCESLETINLLNVKKIGAYTFRNCIKIKSINLNQSTTDIGMRAFYNCTALETIDLGSTLKTIANQAFEGCIALDNIIIPDSVTKIGKSTFLGCSSLKNIKLSNQINAIQDSTFENCTMLKEINIPDGVLTIGALAFANTGLVNVNLPSSLMNYNVNNSFDNCNSLISFSIPDINTIYCSNDGVIYSKDMTTIISYPIAKDNQTYDLNNSIINVGDSAFKNTKFLKQIKMPNVTTIGNYAFNGSKIETINADNLEKIYNNALENSNISSITLNNCKEIYHYAFNNAINMKSFDLPVVEIIGFHAFSNTGISEIVLENSINYLLSRAFAECANLNKVVIKKDCVDFDFSLIFANDNIREIVIEDNKSFVLENGILYNGNKEIIFDYIGSETGKLIINDGVKKIASFAFMNSSITEVELPKSLEVIGEKAFYGIETLKTFIFHSEKAPRLECQYDAERRLCYSNFITEIENIAENNVELNMYHPANASYHNYIYETYFANRYEESEEGYVKLNAKVSDVNNMMEEVINGNTALIEEASKLYSMMTETQQSCVNNSEMLSVNDMALAVKANDNVYIAIAALLSSIVAFVVIASKRK